MGQKVRELEKHLRKALEQLEKLGDDVELNITVCNEHGSIDVYDGLRGADVETVDGETELIFAVGYNINEDEDEDEDEYEED